jgi:hypothetical protein
MKATKMARSSRREPQNLEVRYGEIGISAVVAAVRYQGHAKVPAQAAREPDRWLDGMVAEFAA